MIITDPGHVYLLDILDEGKGIILPHGHNALYFVKRVGPEYPGNIGPPHEGTTIQEVLRACYERLLYLDNQKPCKENRVVRDYLWGAIYTLEARHARERGRKLWAHEFTLNDPVCPVCLHTHCEEHK